MFLQKLRSESLCASVIPWQPVFPLQLLRSLLYTAQSVAVRNSANAENHLGDAHAGSHARHSSETQHNTFIATEPAIMLAADVASPSVGYATASTPRMSTWLEAVQKLREAPVFRMQANEITYTQAIIS